MTHPEQLLSNQICFRIYTLEKQIMSLYRPLLDRHGLTYPQYLVMLVLWEKKELSIGGLCSVLTLDTGTVSPLVKRMERSRLIKRYRSHVDERTVLVRLTEKGRALQEKVLDVPGIISQCVIASGEEYELLRSVLDRTIERVTHGACESVHAHYDLIQRSEKT
jgi:DNA-binding MarR family transcriptional regulator